MGFENKVMKRRKFESLMLFGEEECQSLDYPTLLEVKIHMEPVMNQLRLLATICFTQKFIDDIEKLNAANKQR
jgi:hypothetical protein